MTKRIILNFLVFSLLILFTQNLATGQKALAFESYPNDPLNTRIYTLNNGLKVYLSEYKEEPRIQTFVAVRVGSKNDPAETTGLAHYLEHLMFKGTSNFGTIDWEREQILLKQIEALFEIYRKETDPASRTAIYHRIDSISYIASTLSIPNEYDRLMTAIGSIGTNAGTSNDYTIYMENIPSNQLRNWAMIQAQRFSDPVIRLFHTELETVYEEKNMSLTNDGRLASEALMQGLFPSHPYGLQTTLGEAEHLKNPSIINIKNFLNKYYVPNNMAVVMSGDFDPDEAIGIINEYFGQLKPSPVEHPRFEEQPRITQPIVKEVTGLQAENIQIGWRFEGASSDQVPYLEMISMILSNRRAGLIDQNLNKQQATLGAGAYARSMTDYSIFSLSGRNKRGQSLEEVKELLLDQLDLLKKGEFPDWLMEAAINNLKLQEMRRIENSRGRAMAMAMSFLNRQPYEQTINSIERLSRITKDEVVAFANRHLRDDNYVVVYKRQGQPEDVQQVEKPPITPIHINRDAESPLLQKVKNTPVKPIEPVFIDFEKDVTRGITPGEIEVLYAKNDANPTFSLTYHWDMGSFHDKYLSLAGNFIEFLGTDKFSAEEIGNEFYKLACSFYIMVGEEDTRITISGLSENFDAAIRLFEDLILNARANKPALTRFVENVKKSRQDSKANQNRNFSALVNYATYGAQNPTTFTLTDAELDSLTSEKLIKTLQDLWGIQHRVVFFGPQSLEQISTRIGQLHMTPEKLHNVPEGIRFEPLETLENQVLFAHYDAAQSYLQIISKGIPFNPALVPQIAMYNGYFGGGMNAIVFQELREKRGLAYTARSNYSAPSRPDENYLNTSFIATQNDKVIDAFSAFNELFYEMPVSESSFRLAKDQLISNLRTQRIRDAAVIWNYLSAKRLGYSEDPRKKLFSELSRITLDDVVAFNKTYIKNKPKTYVILGNENNTDFREMERLFGPLKILTKKDLFVF